MGRWCAETIAEGLEGRRQGASWIACCPAHKDDTPSLSIDVGDDGNPVVHCFAGCSQSAVISALKARGLWPNGEHSQRRKQPSRQKVPPREGAAPDKRRIANALKPWCVALPAGGTLVEIYLGSRGICLSPPNTIKFAPSLRHRSGVCWPAMVGLVTTGRDNRPVGIHRTWLAEDGRGKAPLSPNKMMLGPCRGGAVRLSKLGAPLLIGEGIETTLAAMQATGYAGWAALSTSGMRTLELPADVQRVIILADGDAAGEAAAIAAAKRWTVEGRDIRIAVAPAGRDFNDLLHDSVRPDGGWTP